jgi:hypothetical protein
MVIIRNNKLLKFVSLVQCTCNSVAERQSAQTVADDDHSNFNILVVLIAFYGLIFLPQYVLNTNYESEDDLR